ncbi:MAG: hypothetical protein J6V82_00895, partial [Clostridia bacterium]|nr:hypothetical protein [Clostridia bacterium]
MLEDDTGGFAQNIASFCTREGYDAASHFVTIYIEQRRRHQGTALQATQNTLQGAKVLSVGRGFISRRKEKQRTRVLCFFIYLHHQFVFSRVNSYPHSRF